MTQGEVISILKDAVFVAVKLSAPLLLVSILLGLIISIFQAATQIHEQTLTFVPKIIAMAVVLVIMGSWMITTLQDFAFDLFDKIAQLL